MQYGLQKDAARATAAAPRPAHAHDGDQIARFRVGGHNPSLKVGELRLDRALSRSGASHRQFAAPHAKAVSETLPASYKGVNQPYTEDTYAPWRRVFDIVVALVAGVVLSPAIILVCIGIALQGDGPIFFVQERIGRGGKPFRCFKFRSMVHGAEAKLAAVLASDPKLQMEWDRYRKLKRDPRSSKFGEFLRSSSLDELPQLYNILMGDMTLVGPRPILRSELSLYGRWLRCYISVKPGLTGLWQVSGRNHLSYRRRIAMDRFYVNAFSTKLYVSILLATVPAVLFRKGSY
jgi:exopolysaccharide production protein ExoY